MMASQKNALIARSHLKTSGFLIVVVGLALQLLLLWRMEVDRTDSIILLGLNIAFAVLAVVFVVIFLKADTARGLAQRREKSERKTLELLTQDKPLTEVLESLATGYEENFPRLMCSIMLMAADGKHLQVSVAPSLPESYCQAINGAEIGPNVGSCGTAAYLHETVIVSDINTDPRWQNFKDLALAHGLQACWSVPIISSQNAVMGTFAIYYDQPRAPSKTELAAIEHGVYLARLVIEHGRLLNDLREANDFSNQVINCAREGITVFDRDLRRQVFNPFMEKLSAWSASQVLGRSLEEVMPTEQAAKITANLRRALQGETVHSGDEFIPASDNNQAAWVSSKISPLRNAEGEITGVISVVNDISERKQAEESVRQAAELTRQVIAGIEGGIAVIDPNLCYAVFNPFMERITGWKATDVIGKHISGFVEREYAEESAARMKRALNGEIVYSGDRYLAATADHPDLWMNTRASPLHNSNGEITGVIVTVNDITERKRAELDTAKLASIVESSHDAIVSKDLNGIVQSWNTGAEKIFGYTADEMKGQSIMRMIPPNLQDEERLILAHIRAGDRIDNFETVRIRKDGSTIEVAITVSPIRDASGGIVGASKVAHDITERKRVEEALRERELRYRELFQSNPHPMWVFDLNSLQFLAVNDAAVAHYGYSRQEFMSMTIKDIRPATDVPVLLDVVANSADDLHEAGVWKHCTCDGRLIDVEISTHSLQFDGHEAKVVLAHDVTQRKTAEKQIVELNASLEQRIEERTNELEAKSRELESFCYSVSHDLKAPLRGIDGYSRLLLEDYGKLLDDDGRQFLKNVRGATQQMTELIDDLLTYSRQERRSMTNMSIDLKGFVTNLLSRNYADPQAFELRLELEPVTVLADHDGLAIALRNLIDNAIKFSAKAEHPQITIRNELADGLCTLSIKDNGIGFDMRFYDRIFEIFQRLQRAEDYPGTGIGLALVRKAIERMGGKVWAESQPGQGASFYIELAVAAPASSGDRNYKTTAKEF